MPNLRHSTITGNIAGGGGGGGIYAFRINATHSIIAGNMQQFDAPSIEPNDIVGGASGDLAYSLIGNGDGLLINDLGGNQIGTFIAPIDPLLSTLSSSGGPTRTHAFLPGSPAVDAGDIGIGDIPPQFDQRGLPFVRIGNRGDSTDAVIDIGAYEAQGPVTAAPGDYNRDGVVNAADYTVWRDTLDPLSPIDPLTGADGDGDGFVTDTDRDVWATHYGFSYTLTTPAAVATLSVDLPAAPQITIVAPLTLASPERVSRLDTVFAQLYTADAEETAERAVRPTGSVSARVGRDDLLLNALGLVEPEQDDPIGQTAPSEDATDEPESLELVLAAAFGAF